jgi:bifunctional UDP-N-acetylglucosamine pyrophosphorylase / glucosamine-1-phosphate N-acetyltransferase
MAAGQGTRMRSSTPKLLHTICGRPMIEWPVAAAREAGAARIVIVDSAERPLEGRVDGDVEFAIQAQPRGTADAAKAASPMIDPDSPVVVMNGDHPLVSAATIRGLLDLQARSGQVATIATAVLEDPTGYGRVVRAPGGTVERIVETKAAGDASALEMHIREVNVGIYAFDGRELLRALQEVRSDNAQGELYLPDVLPILRRHERTIGAYEISDDSRVGINDRVGLATARTIAQRRIHERLMLAGVTIVDPAATVVDVDVEIGPDTMIAPFSSLHGATRIADGATIGPNTTLIDATVGNGATVVHSYVNGAEIGDRVSVGPFAYLRPGAVLREGSKAGTFVEIKNSDVGPGSKVPHLSYIGDADIGERTNVGAGTITANYDGSRKHRTTIGDEVFVGVDTMLVAPVSIGDGAYTGGGSVITDDVPPGALGVARERQRNIDGYADRRKQRDSQAHERAEPRQNVPAGSEAGNLEASGSPPAE